MPFPISLSGCVSVDTAHAADICRKVAHILERQRAQVVVDSPEHLVLRVPLVRGSGNKSDFVAPLNRIELRLRRGDGLSFLCYRLSVLRTALFNLAFPPIFALFAALHHGPVALVLVGGWLSLVGGNCGVVWWKARPFFERAVREATTSPMRAQQSSQPPTAT